MAETTFSNTKRRSTRHQIDDGVWVYWSCVGSEDTSKVGNLSPGGLFIETKLRKPVGSRANINFLVQEGQIRAEAVVQHVQGDEGIGLKFVTVREEDCPQLAALLKRLRQAA